MQDWCGLFSEYATFFIKSGIREKGEIARTASRMMDKYLKKYREQIDIINFKTEKEMENNHFVMAVTDIAIMPDSEYCRINGTAKSGSISTESEIALSTGKRAFIAEIKKNEINVDSASQGETVSLLVLNLEERDLQDLPNNLFAEAVDEYYEQRLSAELKKHNSKIKVLDVPPTTDALDDPFKMVVDGIYWIEAKKGYLLSGTIEGGFISPDERVKLSNGMKAKVKEIDGENSEWAGAGDKVGILLSGIKNGALDGVENLIVTEDY